MQIEVQMFLNVAMCCNTFLRRMCKRNERERKDSPSECHCHDLRGTRTTSCNKVQHYYVWDWQHFILISSHRMKICLHLFLEGMLSDECIPMLCMHVEEW